MVRSASQYSYEREAEAREPTRLVQVRGKCKFDHNSKKVAAYLRGL
jgi:hypothetical protein